MNHDQPNIKPGVEGEPVFDFIAPVGCHSLVTRYGELNRAETSAFMYVYSDGEIDQVIKAQKEKVRDAHFQVDVQVHTDFERLIIKNATWGVSKTRQGEILQQWGNPPEDLGLALNTDTNDKMSYYLKQNNVEKIIETIRDYISELGEYSPSSSFPELMKLGNSIHFSINGWGYSLPTETAKAVSKEFGIEIRD